MAEETTVSGFSTQRTSLEAGPLASSKGESQDSVDKFENNFKELRSSNENGSCLGLPQPLSQFADRFIPVRSNADSLDDVQMQMEHELNNLQARTANRPSKQRTRLDSGSILSPDASTATGDNSQRVSEFSSESKKSQKESPMLIKGKMIY